MRTVVAVLALVACVHAGIWALLRPVGTAPDVTRQRIYLETMERVLGSSEKLIYDGGGASGAQGVVPYLPLNELTPRRPPAATTSTGQPQLQGGSTR